MTDYYLTYFYSNYDDKINKKLLGNLEKVINDDDMKKGYINKYEFLEWTHRNVVDIDDKDITDNSWIVEYIWSNISDNELPYISRKLQIK